MPTNRIQFQRGMPMPEFFDHCGSEPQCARTLERLRWPDGFRCPRCGGADHCRVSQGRRLLFQCNACRRQTSLTAGTMMDSSKLPPLVWFLAMYLISQAKTGLSALALKRDLGVNYRTAWLVHQKIMGVMAHRDAALRLSGDVVVDDAYPSTGEIVQTATANTRAEAAPAPATITITITTATAATATTTKPPKANAKRLITNSGYLRYIESADSGGAFILDEDKAANDAAWDGLHAIVTNDRSSSAP